MLVAGTTLYLSEVPAMEHINRVCEQHATSCLMVSYVPGAGAVSMAHRTGRESTSTMLDQAATKSKAV